MLEVACILTGTAVARIFGSAPAAVAPVFRPAYTGALRWALLGLMACFWSLPVTAQVIERPQRPVSGLFGGRPPQDPDRPWQSLDFTLSTQGGYDHSGNAIEARPSSYTSFVNAAVSYQHSKQLRTFGVNGSGFMKTYRNLGLRPGYGGQVDMNLSAPVGGGNRFNLSAVGRTDPSYALEAFSPLLPTVGLGVLPGSNPANGFVELRSREVRGSIDWQSQTSRRGRVDLGYSYGLRDFDDDFGDGHDQLASVSYGHDVGRVSRVRASYGYSETNLRQRASAIPSHTADLGYMQQRRLSPTRNFSFGFGAGATTLRDVDPQTAAPRDYVQPSGYGNISLDVARTWSISGNYRRSTQVLRGLTTETFFSDAVMARVGGFAHPRAQLAFSLAFSHGQQPSALRAEYDTYSATTQLQYALSRWVAASASYSFFAYRLRDATGLAPGLPSSLDRSTVRVGVVLWLPLYGASSGQASSRGGEE